MTEPFEREGRTTHPTDADADADAGADKAQHPRGQQSSLGRRAARGAAQTIGAQLFRMALQIVGVVVLARLLTPTAYGLVAMVTVVVGVAEIFRDFGLSTAAIQAESLSRRQRDNLFWINAGAGVVLGTLLFFCSPLLAAWYDEPALVPIARAFASVFVINGLAAQYRASLLRDMRFGAIALTDMVAPVVALAAALVLAVMGAGAWAIVAQQIIAALMLLSGAVLASRWYPGLPHRGEDMSGLLRFGWQLASSQVVGYIGNNIDTAIIGTRFGAGSLGLYNRAFQLLMTPLGQLRQPTSTVAVPVLSRLRGDPAASNAFVERGQVALGFTLVAGLAWVVGATAPVTLVFLGGQWVEAIPLLRLLAIAGGFQTLAFVGYWVYVSHGLTRQLLHYTFVTVAIKIVCVVVGSNFGLVGVAWGFAVAPAIAWPVSFWWLSRSSTIKVRPLYLGALRIITACVVIGLAAFLTVAITEPLAVGWQLGLSAGAALVAYGCLAVVPRWRQDILVVIAIGRAALDRARSS